MAMNNNFNNYTKSNPTADHNNTNAANSNQTASMNGVHLPTMTTLPLPIPNDDDSKMNGMLNATTTLPLIPILIAPPPNMSNLAAAASNLSAFSAAFTVMNNTHNGNNHSNGNLMTMSSPNLQQFGNAQQTANGNGQQSGSSSSCVQTLRLQITQKDKTIAALRTMYESVLSDYNNTCSLLKTRHSHQTQSTSTSTSLLNAISEEHDHEQMAETIREKEAEIEALQQEKKELASRVEEMKAAQRSLQDEMKGKNRELNKLQKENKSARGKVKALEKQNKRLSAAQYERDASKMEKETLKELYLNSNQIKKFMNSIKEYGEQYETLKKRQVNLTNCIGKEDDETLKIRMNDLYHDIVRAEQSYHALYTSLDIIKTESQGKELEVMTRSREQIAHLEQEVQSKASHLDEYVRKNQTLQLDLTDREMKLRQSQNQLNFMQQKLNRANTENSNLMQQLSSLYTMNVNPVAVNAMNPVNINMNMNMNNNCNMAYVPNMNHFAAVPPFSPGYNANNNGKTPNGNQQQ
eukprot:CAMPEP_0197075494 /NCGR_PEP_ID=MMETSP1384-20130603/211638_1 /TAXON_ID=29189 /ORGANISM="Ammonia sp." /LENGTH=520 /DNA_ID=CAMNT_0042514343 /DNA_START=60 /DNA_END=1622 /DNA_ORIENTATION=-